MNPGLNMTLEHEIVKVCKDSMAAAGIEPVLDKKATSTEAAQYFSAGYEAVVFGPGMSQGNSHSPNEHNLLEHIEKATLFYEKLIEKVCV
jgi:acetylornithine deacetylase/succinyl-diaminopimelate desuccinylase-like protein